MLKANPMYNVVFKRMMESERVAKFFIGTLLDEIIKTVEVQPPEFTYNNELIGLEVFRLDFITTIKNQSGQLKKVLIEIQKAKNQIDLLHFRQYLGKLPITENLVGEKNIVLPITTIYILGFSPPEIPSACIKVERQYRDLINKTILIQKSDFVEKLAHDSFAVQIERITDKYQTVSDKLLCVFEQNSFTNTTKVVKHYTHPTGVGEIKIMTNILHRTETDPDERKQIEVEQKAWRTVNTLIEGLTKALTKTEELLDKKEKQIKTLQQ